jgi:hypothetical protein
VEFKRVSVGVVKGSDPERLVVTEYEPVTAGGPFMRTSYPTMAEFRAHHEKNGFSADLIDAAVAEARQNVLT